MPHQNSSGRRNLDLFAPQFYSKEQVNYRPADLCASCDSYNGSYRCSLVEGEVRPEFVCDLWGKTNSPALKNLKAYKKALKSSKKVEKSSVNYRVHVDCNLCAYFNGRSGCTEVKGSISSTALCDKWSIDEDKPVPTGKEFIEEQYKLSKQ